MSTHGETNLETLIATMQPVLHDGVFVFHSSDISMTKAAALDPILIFKEKEGTAVILKKDNAEKHNLPHTYPSRMITLNVHSALNAVGFLAVITKHLAAAGISVNPVSAHYHDHLFIPKEKADEAMHILQMLSLTKRAVA